MAAILKSHEANYVKCIVPIKGAGSLIPPAFCMAVTVVSVSYKSERGYSVQGPVPTSNNDLDLMQHHSPSRTSSRWPTELLPLEDSSTIRFDINASGAGLSDIAGIVPIDCLAYLRQSYAS